MTFEDRLLDFGLTRLEATIYTCLLTNGELSGYEVVKLTGISRSNVYSSLAALVEKGAAYLIEGSVSKYTAVEVKLFVKNTLRQLEESAEELLKSAPAKAESSTGYITVSGSQNIKNKIIEMLENTQARLYFMAPAQIMKTFQTKLEELSKQKKKLVLISDQELIVFSEAQKKNGSCFYKAQCEENQIRLITDSEFVLTGEFSDGKSCTCLYSGQQNLVNVMKEALKNKIELLQG